MSTGRVKILICIIAYPLVGCFATKQNSGNISDSSIVENKYSGNTHVIKLTDFELNELRKRADRLNPDPTAAFMIYRYNQTEQKNTSEESLKYLILGSKSLVSAQLEFAKQCMDDPEIVNLDTALLLLKAAASNDCQEAKERLDILKLRMSNEQLRAK